VLHLFALLGALALGDVALDDHDLGHLAGGVADDAALGLDVANDAVLQLEAELDAPPDAGLDRFPEYRPDAVAVARVDLLEGIGIGADLVVVEQAAYDGLL